jgi:hypothetical protein
MTMATTRRVLLLPCIISLLVLLTTSTAFDSAPATLIRATGDLPGEPSAYEMLEGFGFPRGILPVGVTGYKYRPSSDGAFEVYFDGDCEFEVDDGYRLMYQRTITGNVEGGSIRNLGGVLVMMFLLNWSIDRVVVEDPEHLMFYVGPLSQAFRTAGFKESPVCRYRHSGGNSVAAMGAGVEAM